MDDHATARRWGTSLPLNRSTGDSAYREEWYWEQCGGCAAYRPITGPLGADWGVCTNVASPQDGTVRFEHDGCEAFVKDETGSAPFQ